MPFTTREDIANRGLQHCGALRITSFSDNSKNAAETNFVYDDLRVSELTEHLWLFATKRAPLRPIDTTTGIFTPPLWSPTITYLPGMVVQDVDGYFWTSTVNNNLNNSPGADGASTWDRYFGPLTVQPYDTTGSTLYFPGELVYVVTGAGTYDVYMSLTTGNASVPGTAAVYSATATYYMNQVVSYNSVNYQSLVSFNLGNEPDTSASYWTTTVTVAAGSNLWLLLTGATMAPLVIPYPLNAGPASDAETSNVFLLPNGHLRRAPQNPIANLVPILGAPSLAPPSDWVYEGDYIITRNPGPIIYRFVGDVTVVSTFDHLFCEALGARIGMAVCQSLTQSDGKEQAITAAYKDAIAKARLIDGIERGPSTPALDTYLACRV